MKFIVSCTKQQAEELLNTYKSGIEARFKLEDMPVDAKDSVMVDWKNGLSDDTFAEDDWFWSDAELLVDAPELAGRKGVLPVLQPKEALGYFKSGKNPDGVYAVMPESTYLGNEKFTSKWVEGNGKIAITNIHREDKVLAAITDRGQESAVRLVSGYLLAPTGKVGVGYTGDPQEGYFFMDNYLFGGEVQVDYNDVKFRAKTLKEEKAPVKKKRSSEGKPKARVKKISGSDLALSLGMLLFS